MKLIFPTALALLIACGTTNATMPANVQLNADALTARQTSDAANARSNALSAQATAVRQSTRDAADARATDAAIQMSFARITQTAEAQRATVIAQSNLDHAHATETAVAFSEQQIARRETRAAIGTATRRAENFATQTRLAEQPTQTRVAELITEQRAATQRAQRTEDERAAWEQRIAPLTTAAWYLMPLCIVTLFFILVLIGLWRIINAVETYLQSRALETNARAIPQLIIKDPNGNPLGYLIPSRGSMTFQPIDWIENEPTAPTPPTPPLLTRDTHEAQKSTPPIAAPTEPLIQDFVYPSTLRAFTAAILVDFDWTQQKWRDKVLPRGYVMSMDTEDAHGNPVYGGYSRLIQLYVDRHLIINRRTGKTGDWNPNAPRDLEKVMDILENKASLPSIQIVAPPSPTPPRRRRQNPAIQLG